MSIIWNFVKGFLPGPQIENAMDNNRDIELGCTVVFRENEYQEPIVGEVNTKQVTVTNEMFATVRFEKPLDAIYRLPFEYNHLFRYLSNSGRVLNIPVPILRTTPCFTIFESREDSRLQSGQGRPREVRNDAAHKDNDQDLFNNNDNTVTAHFPPLESSAKKCISSYFSSFTSQEPDSERRSQYQNPGEQILGLLNGGNGGGNAIAAERPYDQTKNQWDVDTGPEFIVPAINLKDFEQSIGHKGIQGRFNSCYLDSTLFTLFGFTDVFDKAILEQSAQLTEGNGSTNAERPPRPCLPEQIRNLLAKYIVNELRQFNYCPAEPILYLRKLLVPLNPKIESQFMDPEESLLLLFDQLLQLKEFINYDNDVRDFLHQIQLDPESKIHPFISTPRLLDLSMKNNRLKFKQIPSPALILEMPRSNGALLNGLKGIIPTLSLDITNLIVDAPRSCISCGAPGCFECIECFDLFRDAQFGSDSTAFCSTCHALSHKHPLRRRHSSPTRIAEAVGPRIKLELLAVICIRACHFVSFVRTDQSSPHAPWVFFDSNPTGQHPIHEILPDMGKWISELEMMRLDELSRSWSQKPAMLKRIVQDAHICTYAHRTEAD